MSSSRYSSYARYTLTFSVARQTLPSCTTAHSMRMRTQSQPGVASDAWWNPHRRWGDFRRGSSQSFPYSRVCFQEKGNLRPMTSEHVRPWLHGQEISLMFFLSKEDQRSPLTSVVGESGRTNLEPGASSRLSGCERPVFMHGVSGSFGQCSRKYRSKPVEGTGNIWQHFLERGETNEKMGRNTHVSEAWPNQNGVMVDWCNARATSATMTKSPHRLSFWKFEFSRTVWLWTLFVSLLFHLVTGQFPFFLLIVRPDPSLSFFNFVRIDIDI